MKFDNFQKSIINKTEMKKDPMVKLSLLVKRLKNWKPLTRK